jgi:adenosine kinase
MLVTGASLSVLLSGSLAFDYIMNFPGYFEDHILPDKIHVLNVSFLVESLDRQRGGVAGNIAYNLGLLGVPCRIVAPAGVDFEEYAADLAALGVDVSSIWMVDGTVTASAFITTDRADNQITGFFPGAMARAGEMSILEHVTGVQLGVVSPTAPDAMERHVREFAEAGVPYVYDPGQQIVSLSPAALREGIERATVVVANDYEFALIQEKTGLSREAIVETAPIVAVTFGELGSIVYHNGDAWEIPATPPRQLIDPTGAGDAYRVGLICAVTRGLSWEVAGRLGALAATYVIEAKGTQAHSYTAAEFQARFDEAFPDYAGSLDSFFGDHDRS